MARKTMTQIAPFLLPLRLRQKKALFYLKMRLDKNRYADTLNPRELPYPVFEAEFPMINKESDYDTAYQQNKVFNLKLAAKMIDGILIKPGETFSFWQLARYAERRQAYKDGLCLINGKAMKAPEGCLCELSDLLFWLFLHTPLKITERHAHSVKNFPSPDTPAGADAAIREGWFDLKVKNETAYTFQIRITFDAEDSISGYIHADQRQNTAYEIQARDLGYIRKGEEYYETVSVYQLEYTAVSRELKSERLLYQDETRLGYSLPKDLLIPEG